MSKNVVSAAAALTLTGATSAAKPVNTTENETSLGQIDKNITYIRTVGKNVQERIHETGLMILAHAQEHGDCTRALKLVEAMPKGMRRAMVVKWFEKFSPIAITVKDKSPNDNSVRLRKSDSKKYNNFNIGGARAIPWFKLEPEQMPDNSWDEETVNGRVISLADSLAKRLKDGKIDKAAVERTENLIKALRAA